MKSFKIFAITLLSITSLLGQTKREGVAADQNVFDWRYDVICNGSGGSGTSYLLDVSVYVPDARLGLEMAKKSAIHAVLLKGITGNNTGCETKNPLAENADVEHSQYINDFFFNQVMYSKFATVPTSVPTSVEALDKKGKSLRMNYTVSVNIDNLRSQLEKDGIIQSLAIDENVRKPTITIIPDENFLINMGYYTVSSTGEKFADYIRAYQESTDIRTAISALNKMLTTKGWSPINAFEQMQGMKADKAFNEVFSGSQNGGEIEVSDIDKILSQAKADIFWKFDYNIESSGIDYRLNYRLAARDAYLKTEVAVADGLGPKSYSASIAELLTQAITDKIDNFLYQHQQKFRIILEKGREVKLTFQTADSSLPFDALVEVQGFGEAELGDIISQYVANKAAKSPTGVSDFQVTTRTQTMMSITVRIPLDIETKNMFGGVTIEPNDSTKFIKELQTFLRQNANVDGTIITKGLGEAVYIVGGR